MDNSISLLNQLHPKLVKIATDAYNQAIKMTPKGVHPVIDATFRSFEESQELYNQGRTTPGTIVSNAKPGRSWHNYGLALDLHLIVNNQDLWFDTTPEGSAKAASDPNYKIVISVMKSAGFEWGGDFPGNFRDVPHFEMKMGQTLESLQAKYNNKDFIQGTEYINF
jgi:peptidoglycan L-alanyl-D-glutamate endopeptidase CwlK